MFVHEELQKSQQRASREPAESQQRAMIQQTVGIPQNLMCLNSKLSNHRLRSFPLPHAILLNTSRDVPCHEFESGRHAALDTAVLHFADDSGIVQSV